MVYTLSRRVLSAGKPPRDAFRCIYYYVVTKQDVRFLLLFKGEEEAYMGLPKSPLCDRSRHTEFSKSQKSFIDFIVLVNCVFVSRKKEYNDLGVVCSL